MQHGRGVSLVFPDKGRPLASNFVPELPLPLPTLPLPLKGGLHESQVRLHAIQGLFKICLLSSVTSRPLVVASYLHVRLPTLLSGVFLASSEGFQT